MKRDDKGSSVEAEELRRRTEQRIESLRPLIRQLAHANARKVRGQREEDFVQAAMVVVCEQAPRYAYRDDETFVRHMLTSARFAMLSLVRTESRRLRLTALYGHAIRNILVELGVGDRLAAETRDAHYQNATMVVEAAMIIGTLRNFADESPAQLVEDYQQQSRVRARIHELVPQMDPIDWAMIKDTVLEDMSLAQSARKHGLDDRSARYRVEKALIWLRQQLQRTRG